MAVRLIGGGNASPAGHAGGIFVYFSCVLVMNNLT
jgi:hypothetical protein